MKRLRWLLVVCCFFIVPIYAQGKDFNPRLLQLDQSAGQALEFTKAGRYEEASAQLEQIESGLPQLHPDKEALSWSDWTVLATSLEQALQVIESPEGKEREAVEAVTSFRLAADAVVSQYQPLWVEMEQPVMSSLQSLKETSAAADSSGFHASLNTFLANYDIIQPSLKVDISKERLQSLEEQVRYVDQHRTAFLAGEEQEGKIHQLEKEMDMVFKEVSQEEASQPSLGWIISITGGIIITTLSYVGWRKYKGHQEEIKEKQNN